jgi:hypothetical protein
MVCQQDLEGIICKPKLSPYPFTWIKVKNPNYTQAFPSRWWLLDSENIEVFGLHIGPDAALFDQPRCRVLTSL